MGLRQTQRQGAGAWGQAIRILASQPPRLGHPEHTWIAHPQQHRDTNPALFTSPAPSRYDPHGGGAYGGGGGGGGGGGRAEGAGAGGGLAGGAGGPDASLHGGAQLQPAGPPPRPAEPARWPAKPGRLDSPTRMVCRLGRLPTQLARRARRAGPPCESVLRGIATRARTKRVTGHVVCHVVDHVVCRVVGHVVGLVVGHVGHVVGHVPRGAGSRSAATAPRGAGRGRARRG